MPPAASKTRSEANKEEVTAGYVAVASVAEATYVPSLHDLAQPKAERDC